MRTRSIGRQRGSVLGLALLVIGMLSLIGLAMVQLAADDNLRENIHYRRAQGEWRVKGACEYAAWQLYSTDSGSENDGLSHPDTDYDWGMDTTQQLAYPLVGTTEIGSTVDLDVSVPDPSKARMREIRAETHLVGRTVVARNVIDLEPYTPALEYAILSDGDVNITGNALVQSDPSIWPTKFNASVHSNGDWLTVWGSADVKGFATSVGNTQIKPGAVDPPINPWGWDVAYYDAEPVPVPQLDPSSLMGGVGYDSYFYYFPSDPALGGGGAKTTNHIDWAHYNADGSMGTSMVFIDGDWRPSGSYEITGRVTLVVNGAFEPVSGNFNFGAAPGSELLIVANSIDIEGNAVVNATLYGYSGLAFDGKGGAQLNGQMITNGVVDLAGTVDLNYIKPSDALWPEAPVPLEMCYQTRTGEQTW
jgi:hypothetical protein